MKRDMELVRKILKHLESKPPPGEQFPSRTGGKEFDYAAMPKYDKAVINEHLRMMHKEGFIRARAVKVDGPFSFWFDVDLEWAGHDFLAVARNDTIWNAAKKQAKGLFSDLTVSVMKALLESVARAQLGI